MPRPSARAVKEVRESRQAEAREAADEKSNAGVVDEAGAQEIGSRLSDHGTSFMLAGSLTFLFTVWTVVRIWKSSRGFAIATLFFLPVAFIPLVRNWGDADTDIRLPFGLTLGCAGYMYWNLYKVAQVVHDAQHGMLQVTVLFA